MIDLSISMVIYRPDLDVVFNTLKSLIKSISSINNNSLIVKIDICDNTEIKNNDNNQIKFESFFFEFKHNSNLTFNYISKNENVGYAKANNFSILSSNSKYHLILNPDVLLEEFTLLKLFEYMEANSNTDIVTPRVYDWIDEYTLTSNQQFLIKRHPTVFQLFLRGFAPKFLKNIFSSTLALYECKDLDLSKTQINLEIVSGCFMFCKTDSLKKVKGFDEEFFLYFEDFDLSKRISRKDYLPEAIIYHKGGNASKKGWLHRKLFIQSAFLFFQKHGWNWF